jgi:hypothetical protein
VKYLFQYILHGQSSDLEETQSSTPWQVYPNPVRSGEDITINIDTNLSENATYSILDLYGREIATDIKANNGLIPVSLYNLGQGIYFLVPQDGYHFGVVRFVVVE